MELPEFRLGASFNFKGERWKCVDVGTRYIVAVRLDKANLESRDHGGAINIAVISNEDFKRKIDNGEIARNAHYIFTEDDLKDCFYLDGPVGSAKVYKNTPDKKLSPAWDLSQERMFVENLLNQRFNFLLVFFSFVIAGAINARGIPYGSFLILTLGTRISFLLKSSIGRAQDKLDAIIRELGTDPMHPIAFSTLSVGATGSKRHLTGIKIPNLIYQSLCLSTLLALVLSFVYFSTTRGHAIINGLFVGP